MNPFDPLSILSTIAQGPDNRYESGQRWTSRRSTVPGFVRDARFDADKATREEIVRKSRYFERNSYIVQRLCSLFEQYTVGPKGLKIVPNSSDKDWNAAAKVYWENSQQFINLTSQTRFEREQSLIARALFVDGECFLIKTRGRSRDGGQSFPRIQLVESHRVSTPPELLDNPMVIDGIELDERGRPVHYWIRESANSGVFAMMDAKWQKHKASGIIHVQDPSRISMFRGLPYLYAVLNDLHDLDDLQMLEMDAAKEAASKTLVIKTKTGELNRDNLRAKRLTVGGSAGTSGGSAQERTQYYDEAFRAKAVVMRSGDEYEQHVSNRPTVATQWFFEWQEAKVCYGAGISHLLAFPRSIQGTVARGTYECDNTFFLTNSGIIADAMREVWLYMMDWGTKNVRELSDPPVDWKEITIRPPRSVVVDLGRDFKAMIDSYKAGFISLDEICGPRGEDWRDVIDARAEERRYVRDKEKEFNLQEGELLGVVMEALKKAEPKQPAVVPVVKKEKVESE